MSRPNYANLCQLLERLEKVILPDDPLRSPSKSIFELNRLSANVEHAQSLLARLEQEHVIPNGQSRKSTAQDLHGMRGILKRLESRLYELKQVYAEVDSGDEYSLSDSETEFADYGLPVVRLSTGTDANLVPSGVALPLQTSSTKSDVTSSLRSRCFATDLVDDKVESRSTAVSSLSQGQSALFADRSAPPMSTTSDVLMNHHSAAQEELTSSLLHLATTLKNSTLSFSDTLASSDPLMSLATKSLDRSTSSMEIAERTMGALRRMTEGKGLWGRWLLYGYIAGLWLAALLLVFVLPKLRF